MKTYTIDSEYNDYLGDEYNNHSIFEQLGNLSDFYESLSFSTFQWGSQGTTAMVNLDTYTYSSIKGTIDSIKEILYKGRINDSYSLLRKYYDSTLINIYTNLYLEDNCSIENYIVTKIENWRKGSESLPEYRVISQYLTNSDKLLNLNNLLKKDDRYTKIRNRCNDHTHYNFYHNFLYNDNVQYLKHRVKYLDLFLNDIMNLFIQHFSYIFYLNDHYLMSSDYVDSKDIGIDPEDGSEYWVANFIQEIFDNIIKKQRPDIAEEILKHTNMQLN